MEGRKELLRNLPLFDGASEADLARIDACTDDIEVEPGEVIVREGVDERRSFVIVSGRAELTVGGAVLAILDRGSVFGHGSGATVTARTPVRSLVIDGEIGLQIETRPDLAGRCRLSAPE